MGMAMQITSDSVLIYSVLLVISAIPNFSYYPDQPCPYLTYAGTICLCLLWHYHWSSVFICHLICEIKTKVKVNDWRKGEHCSLCPQSYVLHVAYDVDKTLPLPRALLHEPHFGPSVNNVVLKKIIASQFLHCKATTNYDSMIIQP